MSSLNNALKKEPIYTHEGGKAVKITPEQMLRRSVLSCLLWEKEFYEDGQTITDRIFELALQCSLDFVYNLAMEARHTHGLRHVPLLLALHLIKHGGKGTKHQIANIIRRADEMTELLTLYWHTGNQKDSKNKNKNHLSDRQLRDGLKIAFQKFDEYAIAKYDKRGAPIRMRDVLALTHPKPRNDEENKFYARVMKGELQVPHTWETAISAAGPDPEKKRTAWEILANNTLDPNYKNRDGRLGYMAVLRNIRNMDQAGINRQQIIDLIIARRDADLVWPFRYLAAARMNPSFEAPIDKAMQESVKLLPVFKGTTIILVDVSGSMDWPLSAKSDMTRMDAAAALASLIQGDTRVFTFSERTIEVPARKGIAGIDAIKKSQNHSGTQLFQAIADVNKIKHDRLIVITDEQATTHQVFGHTRQKQSVTAPKAEKAYMINVASNRNGIGYGNGWTLHLDGFSEGIIRYLAEYEKEFLQQ